MLANLHLSFYLFIAGLLICKIVDLKKMFLQRNVNPALNQSPLYSDSLIHFVFMCANTSPGSIV